MIHSSSHSEPLSPEVAAPYTRLKDQIFDEDKCRNVLVRYCAHIPRNYHYGDGVQLVFLVLRDHLGDEHLGRAGGVLYEMIEVDCNHSDDPGAAFQRWRHDHMHRHANLELPHIPHLTTVSTNITPTTALVKWRAGHPDRYKIMLSDHGMGHSRTPSSPIRHRKSWTIDCTTYVSSRDGGTWPMRRLNPKEFHEMQWNPESPHRGRFIKERSLDLSEVSATSLGNETASTRPLERDQGRNMERTTFRTRSLSDVMIRTYGKFKSYGKKTGKTEIAMLAGSQSLPRDRSICTLLDTKDQPQVSEWEIPNASFARKFGLVADGHSLPPSIKELPVAEEKAMDKSSPSTPNITPLHGSFLPVSPMSRSQSSSPRKRENKQPLHIRMNLTENQVNKLTDAFTTSKRDCSPVRASRVSGGSSSPKPKGARFMPGNPRHVFRKSGGDPDASHMDASAVGELMPGWSKPNAELPNLAERRQQAAPSHLLVEGGSKGPRDSLKPQIKQSTGLMTPFECEHITDWSTTEDDSRGRQSCGGRHHSQEPEPLKLKPRKYQPPPAPRQERVPARDRSPEKWIGSDTYASSRALQQGIRCSPSPRRTQSNAEQIRRHVPSHQGSNVPLPPMPTRAEAIASIESPLFSPLASYFRGPDFPSEKKGGKIMIGDNGWLERTQSVNDQTKRSPSKRIGILEGIKKIARDMTELHYPSRRSQPSAKDAGPSITVSLDAREQSLLYCELEYHISNALNSYITSQLDRGNLIPHKLERVASQWHSLGRPRVIGFRYDLETQIDLLDLHANDFIFHGRRSGNPVEIEGLLHTMKVNARAMRVRTFCQPDKVIAKQIVDAQSLFNLMGVSEEQERALGEVAGFFKVIVERERGGLKRRVEEEHLRMREGERERMYIH
ncbi:hypothetical protein NLU13_3653 [Sarocladium strictum]|uniref:Uncharacterized protein n=1 Tax=Sarocladium strictum TaxID=5046 RepID=A0AA39LAL9_SARSR|nr:hypothetical protein NLU13_3653 [Sarocladium strictum]